MGYKTQLSFFRDIVLYGWNNVKHEIIKDNLTKEESIKLENEYIKKYNTDNILYGYNILSESHPKGSLNMQSKGVVCIETGEQFGSVKECGRKLGLSNSSWITTHIKQRRGEVKGNHYCYLSEMLKIEDFSPPRKNGKSVKCIETKKIFNTMSDCSKEMGIPMTYISKCCNNNLDKIRGYSFVFV